MIATYVFRLLWFLGLVLSQVLICNNIHILNYATPFLYIYFIIKLNSSVSRNVLMLWGAALGLLIDIFSNTPGMNMAATVFLAFLRPSLLELFSPRDNPEAIVPSSLNMGKFSFYKYLITCILVHHITLLVIEFFSFSGPLELMGRILACSLLTLLFSIAVDGIRK